MIAEVLVKTLPYLNYLVYAVGKSIRHPRTPVRFGWCSVCGQRVHPDQTHCPLCRHVIEENPEHFRESPIPWWGTILTLCIGITLWVIAERIPITSLTEPARLLTYGPIGSLFGLGTRKPVVDRKK